MREIRIGNTFVVIWAIKFNDPITDEILDYNLEGKDIELYYIPHCGDKIQVKDFSVNKNTIIWKFEGSQQKDLGVYTIILVENEEGQEQRILDISKAFRLVPRSELAIGEENTDGIVIGSIELESVANFVMLNYVISQETGDKEDVTISQKVITKELNRRIVSDNIRSINTQYTSDELKAMSAAGTLEDDVLYLGFEEL